MAVDLGGGIDTPSFEPLPAKREYRDCDTEMVMGDGLVRQSCACITYFRLMLLLFGTPLHHERILVLFASLMAALLLSPSPERH